MDYDIAFRLKKMNTETSDFTLKRRSFCFSLE